MLFLSGGFGWLFLGGFLLVLQGFNLRTFLFEFLGVIVPVDLVEMFLFKIPLFDEATKFPSERVPEAVTSRIRQSRASI